MLPTGMMQSYVEQISDFTSEPSVRDDDGCILQLSLEADEEAEKNYNCQMYKHTSSLTEISDRDSGCGGGYM